MGVLVAVALAAIALTPTVLESNPRQVGRLISSLLGQPVTIESLEAEWDGLEIQLNLKDARLPSPSDPRSSVMLHNAALTLNPLALVLGGLEFSDVLTVRDASFAITRGPEGGYRAAGVEGHPGLEESTGLTRAKPTHWSPGCSSKAGCGWSRSPLSGMTSKARVARSASRM